MAHAALSGNDSKNIFTLLWLDGEVNNTEENHIAQEKLRNNFGNLKTFEDENDCQQFIRSKSKERFALIVSGRLSREIVPAIHELAQVVAIYVYCMDKSRHEQWAKGFPTIKAVIVELEPLISQIQSDQTTWTKKKEPMPKSVPTNYASSTPKTVTKGNKEPTYPSQLSDAAAQPAGGTSPIQGYEKKPLVSLEDAVAPLTELVPRIEHMVWTVKSNCEDPDEGLTSDESASIMLCSMQWTSKESSFRYFLNEALRSEDRQELKPWLLYMKLIISALSKLGSTRRTIYRGVNTDLSGDYPKGKVFVWWEFLFCTATIKSLENDENFGKTGRRTMFTIECESGKDISRHSFQEANDDILLLPGRQFQVAASLNTGDGLQIIQLKEIKSPFPLT